MPQLWSSQCWQGPEGMNCPGKEPRVVLGKARIRSDVAGPAPAECANGTPILASSPTAVAFWGPLVAVSACLRARLLPRLRYL